MKNAFQAEKSKLDYDQKNQDSPFLKTFDVLDQVFEHTAKIGDN